MIRRAAVVALVGTAVVACAPVGLREPLRVNLAGLESLPGEGMEARWLARIRVQNPNDVSIAYNGLSAELDLNGKSFASGVSADTGEIPRFGESDQLELYRQHDASWSLWTYKDIGVQGLVYASPDSPYLRRVQTVLDKKARLGVDAWSSSDTAVRDLLAPIEETFGREFPGFDPFPFGARSWIHGLVRHVLLAEPLVDDFARCFQGVGPEQAAALADSFRFDACLKRERLLDILRAAIS